MTSAEFRDLRENDEIVNRRSRGVFEVLTSMESGRVAGVWTVQIWGHDCRRRWIVEADAHKWERR